MAKGKVHHWKHGWVPIDNFARRILAGRKKDDRGSASAADMSAYWKARGAMSPGDVTAYQRALADDRHRKALDKPVKINNHLPRGAATGADRANRHSLAKHTNGFDSGSTPDRLQFGRRSLADRPQDRSLSAAAMANARRSPEPPPTGPVPANAVDMYGATVRAGDSVQLPQSAGGGVGVVVAGRDGAAQLAPHRLAVKKPSGAVVGVDARDVTKRGLGR